MYSFNSYLRYIILVFDCEISGSLEREVISRLETNTGAVLVTARSIRSRGENAKGERRRRKEAKGAQGEKA